ncbi:peptide-methionine (R)-S-oxide reductase [Candidatus Pacearchaeota archaeon]|nr:peptide-methionine (R)-S-oxide reductase [Candidatus Pacearchaeota archaeon]|tara:strand:- start:2010 stop:2336 length:327 start_codon:yes stop_codon:yes gene_type:complete
MKKEDEFKHLTEEQKHVLLEKGTESPGSGELLHNKESGEYKCAACGNPLYKSGKKFDSGTGWPSFDDAIPGAVKLKEDNDLGMKRTEVVCAKCGGHCINSVCLDFKKK